MEKIATLPKFTMDKDGYTFYYSINEILFSGVITEEVKYGEILVEVSRFNYKPFIDKMIQDEPDKIVAMIQSNDPLPWLEMITGSIQLGASQIIAQYMVNELHEICTNILSTHKSDFHKYLLDELIQQRKLITGMTSLLSSELINVEKPHLVDEKFNLIVGRCQSLQCAFLNCSNKKFELAYCAPDILALLVLDFIQVQKNNVSIKKCENCGQYFVPSSRSDEKYCDYIFKNEKTCRQLGYEIKINSDQILREYRKIYKTQNARKQRNIKAKPSMQSIFENRFSCWTQGAKSTLLQCQNSEISIEDMKESLSKSDWLKKEES